jgi:hypothetical protein
LQRIYGTFVVVVVVVVVVVIKHNELTLWGIVLLEKLIITQLVKNSPSLMEPECSLPFLQEPATGPYPEPDASNPHIPILFS